MDQPGSRPNQWARHQQRRVTRHDLAKAIRENVIVETKVSRLRRFVEILITAFFSLLILYLLSVIIDDAFLYYQGESLFPFVYRPEPIVGGIGVLVIAIAVVALYIGASMWLALKHHWAKEVNPNAHYPQFTTVDDLANYFQISVAEVNRRQNAGKLIITENFENARMQQLRAHAKQIGLQSTLGDE